MSGTPRLEDLCADVRASGLAWRGAFHPQIDDAVPDFADGSAVATLVLLGFTGGEQWPAFAASLEGTDGRPQPLDRWSRRLIDSLAARHGAGSFYPADGPPWLPFQRWAMRAEPVHVSPIGNSDNVLLQIEPGDSNPYHIEIPADQSSWASFVELDERNLVTLHDILEKASANDPGRDAVTRKIGDYYGSCIDEKAANEKGIGPLRPELDRIAAVKDKQALIEYMKYF